MNSQKNVTIILFQFSVVVKGIERKLTEEGYRVDVLTGNFDTIPTIAGATDLFLVYLPGDIMSDLENVYKLENIVKAVSAKEKKIVILGEHKFRDDVSKAIPAIDEHIWLDRPVESDTLNDIIRKVISGTYYVTSKKKILIVDDDPGYAGMVAEWIKSSYNVYIVTAGMQAISFLLKTPVDMILLDYEMPVVDGPQVLQMLQQEPETSDIPVVFLTGNGTKEAVSRVMALKPSGYLLKTSKREMILECIRKTIGY